MKARGLAGAAVAALALALALVAAGCGGGDEEAAAGRTTTGGTADPQDAMLAYARCMRENGADVPDPQDGGMVITPESGPRTEAERRRFDRAHEQCAEHLENARPPQLSEEQQAELQEAALEHARCMREHGIDMPDPRFEGGTARIPLGKLDLSDPDFREAQKACEHILRDLRLPGREES